jgi:hypothetical protein
MHISPGIIGDIYLQVSLYTLVYTVFLINVPSILLTITHGVHTSAYARTHTHTHTHTHTRTHAHTHTRRERAWHNCTRVHPLAHMSSWQEECTHARTHAHRKRERETHAHTHAHTHMHTHTCTHTHTHWSKRMSWIVSWPLPQNVCLLWFTDSSSLTITRRLEYLILLSGTIDNEIM